jgi:hypothetical protein
MRTGRADDRAVVALYTDDSRFRPAINMGRRRFGEGEYRYFAEPFPEAVAGTGGLLPESAGHLHTLVIGAALALAPACASPYMSSTVRRMP